jgi:hypothetical protein
MHKTNFHNTPAGQVAEITGEGIIINTAREAIDLMGDLFFQGCNHLVLHEANITPEFFNLGNGLAGEILQKFSTYRIRLTIIGDFSKYTRKSIRDFIFESNKVGHVRFVGSMEEAGIGSRES